MRSARRSQRLARRLRGAPGCGVRGRGAARGAGRAAEPAGGGGARPATCRLSRGSQRRRSPPGEAAVRPPRAPEPPPAAAAAGSRGAGGVGVPPVQAHEQRRGPPPGAGAREAAEGPGAQGAPGLRVREGSAGLRRDGLEAPLRLPAEPRPPARHAPGPAAGRAEEGAGREPLPRGGPGGSCDLARGEEHTDPRLGAPRVALGGDGLVHLAVRGRRGGRRAQVRRERAGHGGALGEGGPGETVCRGGGSDRRAC
mmetsp:Transcript_42725/g.86183  ORF Transcript_42725/g.86183 Transcript_42725/m.86183 type:complete len:254 (+) Transcript_42725:14-775(+)